MSGESGIGVHVNRIVTQNPLGEANESVDVNRGVFSRLWRSRWWRWLWRFAATMTVCGGVLFVFASNRFFYLSHQRFSNWSQIQWKYQLELDSTRPRPLVVGHRGSGIKSTVPSARADNVLIGNTFSGIQAAIAANADWIEIDIRKSKSEAGNQGALVLFHDSDVAAKTDFDSRETTGEVSNLTLSQLQALKLRVESNEKILTLDELFDASEVATGETRWIFDLKVRGIQSKVMDWIGKKGISADRFILFGDYEVLREYKDVSYSKGYTTLFGKSWKNMLFNRAEMFDRCDELGCKLMVVPIFFVTTDLVDNAAQRGIDIWCYDSNDPVDLKYAAGCGVKGVIVDHPQRTMELFESDTRANERPEATEAR